jgi:hypothetical protein
MRKVIILLLSFTLFSCAELQSIAEAVMEDPAQLTESQIGMGLKQALEKGVQTEVQKLTQKDGFFKNEMVKIMLPEELQKVENSLRKIGLGNLADEGLKLMNRAAEDAVKEATPIFVSAIKQMTIEDAKNILMGSENAATQYLESKTQTELYNKFFPVVEESFSKVGADQIWTTAIDKYNTLPFTSSVDNNLSEYVTQQALQGVYTMIAQEETKIRTDISERTTDLLKSVFALQDKK